MVEREGELRSEAWLEVWQQVQLAAVVAAVASPAERHDTFSLVAAAERARHQVHRVDRPPAADETSLACDPRPLGLRSRADPGPAMWRHSPKTGSPIEPGMPAKPPPPAKWPATPHGRCGTAG